MKSFKFWTKDEDEILINNYYITPQIKDLCYKLTERTHSMIKYRIRVLGLYKRKINVKDETFFNIPNELNSSVAGLIASDGHIRRRDRNNNGDSYSISITLKNTDRNLLEDINKNIKSSYKITEYTKCYKIPQAKNKNIISEGIGTYCTLDIFKCKNYYQNINKNWNIPYGAKSLILEPPINLENINNQLAYICGLINGDGSIFLITNGNYKSIVISLLGTYSLLNWIKKVFENYINSNIDCQIRKDEYSRVFSLTIRGTNSLKLFNKMHSLNCIFLNRKWENPEILSYIEEKKKEHPELFITVDKQELQKYL